MSQRHRSDSDRRLSSFQNREKRSGVDAGGLHTTLSLSFACFTPLLPQGFSDGCAVREQYLQLFSIIHPVNTPLAIHHREVVLLRFIPAAIDEFDA